MIKLVYNYMMNSYEVRRLKCPKHCQPITLICCSNHCDLSNIVCQGCEGDHQGHKGNLMSLQKFENAVMNTLEEQNRLDVNTLGENNGLICKINQYRSSYNEKEQGLLKRIITELEREKQKVLRKTQDEREISYRKSLKYLQRLSKNKMMEMRIKFSSAKGLSFFQQCSEQAEGAEPTPEKILETVYEDSSNLTKILSQFVKLKISKKEAMKISLKAPLQANNYRTERLPSPKKKRVTTNKNFQLD